MAWRSLGDGAPDLKKARKIERNRFACSAGDTTGDTTGNSVVRKVRHSLGVRLYLPQKRTSRICF